MKKVRAVFDGKALYPEEPIELETNGHYVINIEPVEKDKPSGNVESDSAYDIASLAIKTGISDLATEHDYYLYGTPKRKKE